MQNRYSLSMAIYRVNKKDLQKGQRIESKEHPGFSERTQRKIARQHLQKYGPGYYRAELVNEKVVQNINKKMHAKPMKKKKRPVAWSPLSGSAPPWVY